jgi:hypothetical protein
MKPHRAQLCPSVANRGAALPRIAGAQVKSGAGFDEDGVRVA